MHGIIFAQLRTYTEAKHGKDTWAALLKRNGLESRVYLSVQQYPDAEMVALLVSVAALAGLQVGDVLEDFGVFLAPRADQDVRPPPATALESH